MRNMYMTKAKSLYFMKKEEYSYIGLYHPLQPVPLLLSPETQSLVTS